MVRLADNSGSYVMDNNIHQSTHPLPSFFNSELFHWIHYRKVHLFNYASYNDNQIIKSHHVTKEQVEAMRFAKSLDGLFGTLGSWQPQYGVKAVKP